VSPTKCGRAKNVQNSARFLTTFDFDRKYLGNDQHNEKLKLLSTNYDQSPVGQNKFGKLWSTNKELIGANVNTPKWTFFSKLDFGPYGVQTPHICARAIEIH